MSTPEEEKATTTTTASEETTPEIARSPSEGDDKPAAQEVSSDAPKNDDATTTTTTTTTTETNKDGDDEKKDDAAATAAPTDDTTTEAAAAAAAAASSSSSEAAAAEGGAAASSEKANEDGGDDGEKKDEGGEGGEKEKGGKDEDEDDGDGDGDDEQTKKDKESASELTKRLQKLALERQKVDRQDRLKVIQSDTSSHLSSVKSFQELNLPKHLLDAIFAMGFDRPSAIQEEALPRILADPPRNVIGQAQSGSGKTAAFTLGMLFRIEIDSPANTQALCVTPTRELAVQIFQKAVTPMASHMTGLKVQLALSGEQVERGSSLDAHLVIGTPGKIVDWIKRRIINTKTIKVFVLDEADEMVSEDGHRANSLLIKKSLNRKCQCLFFSATFPPDVVKFADKMVTNPDKILIEAGPESLVLDVIKQLWIDTRSYEGGKLSFLADIYSLLTIGQSIVFVGTKRDANNVHDTLTKEGYSCSLLHGQVDNAERDATMDSFRKGQSNVLITTNLLARGVDVDNVCLVVNYDVPVDKDGNPDFETYLHRIGRTGRFGRKGTAINLISDQRAIEVLAAIEAHFSSGKEMIANAPPDPEELADVIEI